MSPSTPSSAPLRPLAQVVPRLDGDALVFVVGSKQVRIEGDARLLSEVLARCDGRVTADAIAAEFGDDLRPEVEELLATLLEHEIVVDCTQAYRLLHRQSSSASGLFRDLAPAELEALTSERFLPRSTSDRREQLPDAGGRLLDLAARRSSSLPGAAREVSFAELSSILRAVYGTAPRARPVPSAGGLYPLVVHALVREPVAPLEPGLWWYDPAAAELQLLRPQPIDVGEVFLRLEMNDRLLEAGRPLLFVSADLERTSRKYSNRGYRYALMEAGAAMQNAYLEAVELGLPLRAIGGFHDDRAHEYLDLPEQVRPLLALLLGT